MTDPKMMVKYRKPGVVEMQELLIKLKGWEITKDRLEKEFNFDNFARAMIFVNKIINPIEENQNYPRILIRYNRVHVSLFTNEAGGLTLMDFEMAKEFNRLAS